MPGVDVFDHSAWDDHALVDDWNTSLAEYQKYHSIHKEGKRLEDVLAPEELKELQEAYADVLEGGEEDQVDDEEGYDDAIDMDMPEAGEAEARRAFIGPVREHDSSTSGHRKTNAAPETSASHDKTQAAPLPQVALGSVQDENLKNMMMAWYFVGYYQGIYEEQQKAADVNTKNGP